MFVFSNVRMGALCRPPSPAELAGPSGRALFHSSHLGLQKREREISAGGVLGAGRTGGAAAPPGSRRRILLEPEPKHSSAPHELLYSVKHEKSPYTTPLAPQNLSFAAQLWTSFGKSRSGGNPREARSPGTPAERRFG